ncbi:hypothetical protein CANARDRAFT_29379 [[Candida] arabinofermentans NRRL YB-2248]|uniref:Deacetylase sirtuin-type domain-containing protein n=1 Tax=[Candida] arabinofermentans NRRL YB-2248 TaxID=983967 RepID=A0A1E4SXL3_9ASCO|nr:hypothetical protein CANARDRAFT_29379 [[Candida] arabinofermentans NRRL YB-2248]
MITPVFVKKEEQNVDVINLMSSEEEESSSPPMTPEEADRDSNIQNLKAEDDDQKIKYEVDMEEELQLFGKLLNQMQAPSSRKPKLKYRPPNGTVLDISKLNLLSGPLEDQVDIDDVSFLHHALLYSKKMVVITGAGISVDSGIPDFRSSNGLFQDLATKSTGSGKNLFDYNVFRSQESINKFEKMVAKLHRLSSTSKPTKFHHMLDGISSQGRMQRLYTQNIDCLDVQLPSLQTEVPLTFKMPFPKAIQLHGNIKLINCSKCNYIAELEEDFFTKKESLSESQKLIKNCPECEELNEVRLIAGKRTQSAGILRPRIVLYNEFHPDGEIIGNITESDLKSKPDCLVVVGTTLKIPGVRRLVKEMSKVVHSNKGCIIWINLEEPTQSIVDYVEYFDLIVSGNCQLVPDFITLYDHQYAQKKTTTKKAVLPKTKKTNTGKINKPLASKVKKEVKSETSGKINKPLASNVKKELKSKTTGKKIASLTKIEKS